jgi:predicted site-specific integrase-resolvase
MKSTYRIDGDCYDCTEDIIALLRITKVTLAIWVGKGKLPRPLKLGNRHYYNRKLVQEYLAREIPNQQEPAVAASCFQQETP